MNKEIKFADEARALIKEGVDAVANAVKVTLGPKGKNVIIRNQEDGALHITKDGITVAKAIDFNDPYKSTGVRLIKDISKNSNDESGDGSTTSALLGSEIITVGLKNITAGAEAMSVKKGIDKALKEVIDYLDDIAIDISDDHQKIKDVATVSANGDEELGELISKAIIEVTKDGVITLEDSRDYKTTSKTIQGAKFKNGYISPYFINNKSKKTVELDNPYILTYDGEINKFSDIVHIIEKINKNNDSILIVANNVDKDALNNLIINASRGTLKVAAVIAPSHGDRRVDILKDIAVLTGGVFVSKQLNVELKDITVDDLGRATKVIVDTRSFVIIEGKGKKDNIDSLVSNINQQIKIANKFEIDLLKDRIKTLIGGVGVIYVGGINEIDLKERKDRIEDALNATKAALEEGIIPGGGIALLRASQYLHGFSGDNEDENIGISIVKKAIQKPLRQILINAGVDASVIINEVARKDDSYGYNARADEYTDMYKAGIIDPKKVTRTAIENACSIAGLFLTTECVIVNKL